jgi:hypothetical protein
MAMLVIGGVVAGATSPFWGPYQAVDDGYDTTYFFARYPYQHGLGYMSIAEWPECVIDPADVPPHGLFADSRSDYGNHRSSGRELPADRPAFGPDR